MGLNRFDLQNLQRIPNDLLYGQLYACFACNVVVHLCPCGCGEKVVLPIAPDQWSITFDGESVSLSPSIGNYQFPCKSHYWIKNNNVIWESNSIPSCSIPQKHSKKKRKHRFWKSLKNWL